MKLPTIALLAALLAFAPASAGTLRLTGNKSVTVTVTLKDTLVAPGATADLAFLLQPVDGIHINLQPALDFKLDTASRAALAGGLILPKGSPYLNTSAPVVQRFQIPKDAKPGPITLKGTLVYFFCSDKEGWCSKFKQPVEIALTVRR
jgi:hypothetical protein